MKGGNMEINFNAAIDEKPLEHPSLLNSYLVSVKGKFRQYDEAIKTMHGEAKALKVKDDTSNKSAVEMASQVKKLTKKVETLRKQIVEAPNKFVKSINTFAKSYKEPLIDIETDLKNKIGKYQVEQERKRREAERKAKEEVERLQAKLDAEAEVKGEEPIKVPELVIPDLAKVTRTESGSASIRKVWAWELENFSELPDEYKKVDEVALNKAVKSGARNIPGVKIFQKSETVIR
jgi:hypothetical protein